MADTDIMFSYNVADTKKFPGLLRPWDGPVPRLTPVYFRKEVLLKYLFGQEHKCIFSSETYGNVYGESFYFSFGINPNRKVIIWLTDIFKLPKSEQQYLKSFNEESDGDITSEFYDAQIHRIHTFPIIEVEIMLLKAKVAKTFAKNYGFELYEDTIKSINEVFSACGKYKKIIFNGEDEFRNFIIDWTNNLIEDLQVQDIKKYLKFKSINFDNNLRQLKILEKFIREVLGNTENIIAPFYFLYDFRNWAVHRGKQEEFEKAVVNLGLTTASKFETIYLELMKRIKIFLDKLLMLLI